MALSALLGPLLLLGLAWGIWLWSGTPGSLAAVLTWANWVLPADQQLRTAEVQGDLQRGGQIGQLHWQKEGLQVHISQADVQLDWSRLWDQPWPVKQLRMGSLHIDDQSPPKAPTPLTSLTLPMKVQMAWQVDRLSWQKLAEPVLSDVRGQYAYDGQQHTLSLEEFKLAQGRYTLQAQLQAAAPMALNLQWQGQVQMPGHAGRSGRSSPTLDLHASVQGKLSGAQAQLDVQAQLAPTGTHPKPSPPSAQIGPAPSAELMQLQLQALIQPWQKQVVVQAHVEGYALDLALLWPGAPQTRLTGQAKGVPDAQGWHLETQWRNLNAGPWDLQRLPLSQLDAQIGHQNGLWQLVQAKAQMAGGQVQGQGRQTANGWTGQIGVKGLLPAELHTALAGPAVQGQLQAEDAGQGRIELQADLQASTDTSPPRKNQNAANDRLQWDRLQLQGQWQEQVWDIRSLTLEAAQARLSAQFKYQVQKQSAQGQAQLNLPGLQAQVQGLVAPATGQGQLDVRLQDAAQSLSWLQRWPAWAAQLKGFKAFGTGELQARWQGGFAQADTPIELSVKSPRVQYTSGQTAPWQIMASQFQLQGTLQALQAQADVQIAHGSEVGSMTTRLRASRAHAQSDEWQAQVDSLRLDIAGHAATSPWRAELQKAWPWQISLNPTGPGLQWAAASWSLQGPKPGTAKVLAEAGQWRAATPVRAAQAQGAARWEDLPLNWLPGVWGPDIQSDVMLQGQWQMQLDKQLNMSASMQRSRGDLRVRADNAPGQRLPAGLREARVQWRLQGERMEAELAWDSEHMGQIKAQVQSLLSTTSQGLQWDEQAPVTGSMLASLPQIGAWSLLAPPGWRVQGTLESRFELSGTRSRPQWQGRLQADHLAVRSAVQGIEFSQGQLIAKLQGQQVVLERLSLRGAGTQGGDMQATGQLSWDTAGPSFDAANPLSAASLVLQMQAKSLRVSNRADRRLAISGDVTAEMNKGQLRLKGLVQADQALFILPEESTPSLGADVRVIRADLDAPVSTPPAASKSWLGTPDVQIQLDLGSDFRLQGQGLNTRLMGQVLLVSNSATRGLPRLTGQVRTEGGRYKAYGQQLDIDTGELRFNGPYDNPSLDIIALRPNLSQRVGVQVTGTALLPRIRLYADPDMPDADKLAWLVLGRSAASGGAESAVLQQAALALLGGNGKGLSSELATSLGLDEISLASGSRSDTTATGAAVTLGKRLSKDFYMVYESSLSGTFGSLYIFYDLSRRLTLRAQAGQQSALDLIFTVRKD